MTKHIMEKLKEAKAIADFCKAQKIPKSLVKDMSIDENGDLTTTLREGTYKLGHLEQTENENKIVPNNFEYVAYMATLRSSYQLSPYEYHPGENIPMYVDGNEVHLRKPEVNYAYETYQIQMKNGYDLHISPYANGFAFSLGMDPSIRDVSGRLVSPHAIYDQIDEIYTKVNGLQVMPVLSDQIIHDPWDGAANSLLAECMEHMIHPIKSDPEHFSAKWGNTISFIDIELYKGLQAMAQVYDSPAVIQAMAEKAIELTTENRSIQVPLDRKLDAAEQHELWGKDLDQNDKIEDADIDKFDAPEPDEGY